jgi:hypothetical protein
MALILFIGHGQPFTVCPWPDSLFQAEEGRRALKAKVAKIIKETILLFSDHYAFHFFRKTIKNFNPFY